MCKEMEKKRFNKPSKTNKAIHFLQILTKKSHICLFLKHLTITVINFFHATYEQLKTP